MVNLSGLAGMSENGAVGGMEGGEENTAGGGLGKDTAAALNRCQYTIPGVLHFIQHEWAKFEMERAQWEMEKADLLAQVSFLKGERKGQENLKNDLVRRIKMLEFALKAERAKVYKLQHGREPEPAEIQAEAVEVEPLAEDGTGYQPSSSHSWHQGRQLLRQYLEEIGYSEKMLELRLTRAQSILGVAKPSDSSASVGRHAEELVERALRERDSAVRAAAGFLGEGGGGVTGGASDSEEEEEDGAAVLARIKEMQARTAPSKPTPPSGKDLSAAEARAIGEFDFLNETEAEAAKSGQPGAGKGEGWDVTTEQMNRMKEAYLAEARSKKQNSTEAAEAGLREEMKTAGLGGELEALGSLDPASTDDVDPGAAELEEAERRTWACKLTLRSHFDGIRAMGFHPVEPLLLTASTDATLKMWNLNKGPGSPSKAAKGAAGLGSGDMEPVATFRGHRGPILCLCLSPTGDAVYTGGLDSTIRAWTLPSPSADLYEPYDKRTTAEVLTGHSDAVWSLAYHSGTENRLLSASADGTVKVWEPGAPESLLSSIPPPAGAASGDVPVSLDFVSTEPRQAMVAYRTGAGAAEKSRAYIIDLTTGTAVMRLELGAEAALVHQILSHPTMPLAILASADAYIRFFDAATGSLSEAIPAHTDAVTSLSVEPNGLLLLSGSHDGSLRLWNLESKSCLQEITAHRRKLDEAVLAVAFHPSRPLLASAGADANAKIFV